MKVLVPVLQVLWAVPMPLGPINNSRSMVSLENLVDLIEICLSHPEAVAQTLLVIDGEDL